MALVADPDCTQPQPTECMKNMSLFYNPCCSAIKIQNIIYIIQITVKMMIIIIIIIMTMIMP